MSTLDEETRQRLLVGLIDGELSPEEAHQANQLLSRSAEFRREFEEQREVSDELGALSTIELDDAVVRKIWKSPFSRFSCWAGIWMVLGGYGVLLVYAVWQLLANSGEEPVVNISTAAILIGSLIVLISVVGERLRTWKSDPYRNVER